LAKRVDNRWRNTHATRAAAKKFWVEEALMLALAAAFGVPSGHVLRLVRSARRGRDGAWEQEHEEYGRDGRLVAVYESWSSGRPSPAGREGGADGRGGFVKYAPDGRLLRRVAADRLNDRAATAISVFAATRRAGSAEGLRSFGNGG
jgi:hypothetical protein